MKKLLNGKWFFKESRSKEWLDAEVPGCNYIDLMALGKIPDPFYGMNEKKLYWVAETDWEYKRVFMLDEKELNHDRVSLVCEMLDTVAEVYLNGESVGRSENCHIRHSFDVKRFLKPGENELRIVLYSPANYILGKYEQVKTTSNFKKGLPHIRKPQCHFGWDWGPVLPPSGITKDIYIEFLNTAKINDVLIEQKHSEGLVSLKVYAELCNFDGDDRARCEISVLSPDGAIIHKREGSEAEFEIAQPELWWTNDQSDKKEQPLYTVITELYKEEIPFCRCEKKIGLRSIELEREKDKYGYNFRFILNGVPLFIKGANWIPPDSFITRFDEKKLKYVIDAALFSNMNMIRIWGGGYYGSDEFYEMCDKYGILIWQDFMFACQPYPFFEEEFLSNVLSEVSDNVKRLRHHASLALWCGNNEIEQISAAWRLMKKYVDWTEKFFYHILPAEVKKHDAATPYIPGSPCGFSHNSGVHSDEVGDTHLWSVWHGLQPMNYYRKRLTRFCSEFGFESLPDIKTVESFATEKDYSLSSPVFTAHQKCSSGNMIMAHYILSRFRLPRNFVDFIYLSQITQQECISDATEHWRRNKGRCNGAIYWQFNDCWPVCSWASMDYYGNYKALQYTARHFNAPLSISIEDNKDSVKVYVLNDKNRDFALELRYKIFDFVKGVLDEKSVVLTVKALKNREAFGFDLSELKSKYNLKKTGLLAELLLDGKVISRKTLLFNKEKNLELPHCRIEKKAEIKDGYIKITLKTDSFARLVMLGSKLSSLPFSDNYFDILPEEELTVTQAFDENLKPQKQLEALTVFSCSDVEPSGSVLGDKLKHIRILARPAMFARRYLFNLFT